MINEENVVSSFGEEQINGGSYRRKSKTKVILGAVLVALIVLVSIFGHTNLKYIMSPNKMKFLNYLDKDIKAVASLYKENDFVKFIINKKPKVIDITIKAMGSEVSGTSVINKDSCSIKINGTNDKYYLIDLNNLDKLYENLGIEKEVPVDTDAFSKQQEEKLKEFGFDCYNIFKNALTNDDFFVIKNNKILINGQEIEADSVELKITETKIMEIAKLLLEELRNSDVINIIFETVDDMEVNREEFIESLDEALATYDDEMEKLKESIAEGYYDEEYIIYRMYNKNGIVAREFIAGAGEEIDSKLTLITADSYYEYAATTQNFLSGEQTEIVSDTLIKEKDITYHNIKLISQYNKRQYVPTENDGANPFSIGWGSYEYVPVTEEEELKIKAENDNTKFTLVGVDGVDVVVDIDGKLKVDVSASGIDINLEMIENKKMTTKKLIEDGAIVVNNMTKEEFEKEINKIDELLSAPKVNTVQSRSQVNADIRTGEQIGKAIRIWTMDGNDRKVPILETKYYELEGIEDYISPDYKPNSLKGAEYYVSDDDGKITIAIAKEAADVGELYINDIYDGTGAGWVYIEGQY